MGVSILEALKNAEMEVGRLKAQRDGYKKQIIAADNIIATYGIDGPLLHDRVFSLISRLEAQRDELLEACKRGIDFIPFANYGTRETKKQIFDIISRIESTILEKNPKE